MTDRIVRHGLGTTEAGQALLARKWGTQGHRTEVSPAIAAQRQRELEWCDNDTARDCHRYIWQLDDATVLKIARRPGGKASAKARERLSAMTGGWVNPYWVTADAAEDAYVRGIMDAEEMDRITR